MIRTEYLFAPARITMQHCTFITVFTPILLLTLSITTFFQAVTAAALVSDDFLYHHPILTHHLIFSDYPKPYLIRNKTVAKFIV